MPLYHCKKCMHEWISGMDSATCDWCGAEGLFLAKKNPREMISEKPGKKRKEEMRKREYYYHMRQYSSAGIEPYLDHCQEFLRGERTIPVTKVGDSFKSGKPVYFTLTVNLIAKLVRGDKNLEKAYKSAIMYGFRGFSRGGQNGIFLLRPSDHKMRAATEALVRKQWLEIFQDLDLFAWPAEEMIPRLTFVKIVHHDPSGKRVVGVMYKDRIIFLGTASY